MITLAEVAHATRGALRLACYDRQGLRYFDDTLESFWRSFYAAAVVAPPFAALTWVRLAGAELASGPFRILLIELIAYVIGWVAFPLAMYYVVQRMGRMERYLRYVAAHNWATVLEVGLYAVVALLAESGLLRPGFMSSLAMLATFAILGYRWFVARVGLDASRAAAAGVVFLALAITILLNAVKAWML